jgi:DnaA family protein
VTQQLALPLRPPRVAGLGDFVLEEDTGLIQVLHALARGPGPTQVMLWGPTATGKTHLLTAVCAETADQGRTSHYLPLRQLARESPALLDDLETRQVLAFDDLDAIAGDQAWEEALFALYERARRRSSFLFAADRRPDAMGLRLADLRSRLAWGAGFRLPPLTDSGRLRLIEAEVARRGLRMDPGVAALLLTRCPRDSQGLVAVLERLDEASMIHRHRLSLPFVRGQLSASHKSPE